MLKKGETWSRDVGKRTGKKGKCPQSKTGPQKVVFPIKALTKIGEEKKKEEKHEVPFGWGLVKEKRE